MGFLWHEDLGRPGRAHVRWLTTRVAMALLAVTCGPWVARAEAGRSDEVQGLAPGGAALVKGGLGRVGPWLVARILERPDGGPLLGAALASELASSRPLQAGAVYPKDNEGLPRALFVTASGLTPQGEVVRDWLRRAKWHAVSVEVPPEVEAFLEGKVGPVPLAGPPPGKVEEAWAASGGAADPGRRLDAAADALARLWRRPGPSVDPGVRVKAERAMAEALVRLAGELGPRPRMDSVHADEAGRYLSPDTLWRGPTPAAAPDVDVTALLLAVAEGRVGLALTELLPKHPQYVHLVEAARTMATRCEAGGFSAVTGAPEKGGKTPKGKAAPALAQDVIQALQRRLGEEGFSIPVTGVWDETTEAAVVAMRRARHLKDQGGFDKELERVLAVTCEARLQTLLLNVRRWRHSAWAGERERVEVNLAGQVVRYFRDDTLIMKQRTVVGSDKSFFSKAEQRRVWRNATPILHDTISMVVVNPEWNVPARIAREEIEPEIAKDPEYVAKRRFRVVETGGGRIYVQEAGPGNALGQVKILFPNSESVYLHDTPGRAAFKLPVRALSHGCVRVDNALDFATELVRSDRKKKGEDFDPGRLKWITQVTTKTWSFPIEDPVPVFLEYYTASVDEDGVLWFHPDIYGYDAETLAAAGR